LFQEFFSQRWHDLFHGFHDCTEFDFSCVSSVSHSEDTHRSDVLLVKLICQIVSQLLTLSPWGAFIVPVHVAVQAFLCETSHSSTQASSSWSATGKALVVLLKQALSLLQLSKEFGLCAFVVPIDVEEIMNCNHVLLVELTAEPFKHSFQLTNVDISAVVDVTAAEELHTVDVSLLHQFQQFEHGFVLK